MKLRRSTAFLILGVLALPVIAVFLANANWRTASRAEVDRRIDPTLLKPYSPPPDELARYQRLGQLLSGIAPIGLPNKPKRGQVDEATARFWTNNGGIVTATKRLLDEGPFAMPLEHELDVDYQTPNQIRSLQAGLRLLALNSRSPLPTRIRFVAIGEKLARRYMEGASGAENAIIALSTLQTIDQSARRIAEDPDLTQEQQDDLARSLPEIDPIPLVENAVRGEFQSQIYPLLPDPSILLKDRKLKGRTFAEDGALAGAYDSLQTATRISKACMEQIHAADQAPPSAATPVTDQILKEAQGLPGQNYVIRGGLSRWWGKTSYRYNVARIPNSFGISLMDYVVGAFPEVRAKRAEALAWRRLLRLQIACRSYYSQTGRIPGVLDDVVHHGDLREMSLDPYTGKPFHYDPKRTLIWSVGANGIDDDGGSFRINYRPADLVMNIGGKLRER